VPRDRGRAARPEHGVGRRPRRVPVRRAPLRHDARPAVRHDRPEPGRSPDRDDPGPRRALRRCRRPDPGGLELTPEAQAPAAHGAAAGGGGGHVSTYVGTLRRSRLYDSSTVGTVGIVIGVVACLIAIPPFTARSAVWPVLLGIVAVLFG